MLAQFALIVFALCAVLSLVIDIGYARLTQAQMQNAADTAALEGVRARDNGPLKTATGLPDGFVSDCQRRAAANRVVRHVFDDDLDSTNGDPDYQFGAGPIIDLTDGATTLHAGQTTGVPAVHSYKPDLQLNQQNAVHGDMVSGSFAYSADPFPSEDLNYDRTDFNPNPRSPQPAGSLAACPPLDQPQPPPTSAGSLTGAADGAFLVRLRRSNERQDLAAQTDPDVASSGPALPLTFGKGTLITADDASGGYSVRRDGLTVRATAIAQIRPALRIGASVDPTVPHLTPFALRDTFVQTVNQAGTPVTINRTNGVICSGVIPAANIATCVATAPNAIGRFVGNRATVNTVGQALPAPAPAAVVCGPASPMELYGAVFSLMASGANRIIGFNRIALGPTGAPTATSCPAAISRGVSLVAPRNATASLIGGLPLPIGVQQCDVDELLQKNRGVGNTPDCPVFAPVNYAPVLVAVLAR